ncbi:type II toxin-antitoxin system RelE/ParE family toxin [Candidatus Woesearchaeota archaeon]|nr:type II toxin-antitoxin system RelE/ParE family toxin [Candidatus Woesearchaeota archaeon]
MVRVFFEGAFEKTLSKIRDGTFKIRVKKQIEKIVINPEIGKPMRYDHKGTRELYVEPYRLSYSWIPETQAIVFLDLYHKDEQ